MEEVNPILVTGFSNSAINHLGEALLRRGVRVLRIGQVSSISSALASSSLEARLSEHPEAERLAEMRRHGLSEPAAQLEAELSRAVIMSAEVCVTTCLGAGSKVLADVRFEQVLMDEAAQACETATLIPLAKGAVEVVMVGDPCQLGPQLASHHAQQLRLGESLLARLQRLGAPTYLLDTQYRMTPALSAFPSAEFYAGKLHDGVSASDRAVPCGFAWPDRAKPLVFLNIGSRAEELEISLGSSKANPREVSAVCNLTYGLLDAGIKSDAIGIISPYVAQIERLSTELYRALGPRAPKVAAVDAYQGRECDVIIVSTVRSSAHGAGGVGFLNDRRRLNVLLTRARCGLLLVGHIATLMQESSWARLLTGMHRAGLVVGSDDGWDPDPPVPADGETAKVEGASKLAGPGTWLSFLTKSNAPADGAAPMASTPAELPTDSEGTANGNGGEGSVDSVTLTRAVLPAETISVEMAFTRGFVSKEYWEWYQNRRGLFGV